MNIRAAALAIAPGTVYRRGAMDRYSHIMRSFLFHYWFLIFLSLGIGAAFFFPGAAHAVIDPWEPRSTVAISLFLMAWTMPTRSLVAEVRRPWASVWAVVLSYGLVPASAWLLGRLTPSEDVRLGLILIACVPCTLSSAILWTRMAGGNEATALLTVLGTTFTSWFATIGLLYVLTGESAELDVGAMMVDLVLSLIVPFVLGQALRRVPKGKQFAENYKVLLAALAQVFVLLIVLKAGVKASEEWSIRGGDAQEIVAWSLVLAIVLHLWSFAAGWLSCGWLGMERGRQIAVAFSASQKTLQVSLILLDQFTVYSFAIMPLLSYHVGQLLIDTAIAKRILRGAPPPEDDLAPGG